MYARSAGVGPSRREHAGAGPADRAPLCEYDCRGDGVRVAAMASWLARPWDYPHSGEGTATDAGSVRGDGQGAVDALVALVVGLRRGRVDGVKGVRTSRVVQDARRHRRDRPRTSDATEVGATFAKTTPRGI